jgi:dihydrofolate synthase/folylpolyglutamate synthase
MNYQETLDYLFAQLPMFQRIGGAAYKADLSTTLALDDYFGSPHRQFRTIHVAGTNGKGSVSHMLATVFQRAGFKTGLYTSPHLVDFRERVKINGQMIPESEVVTWVEQHKATFSKFSPSFFEMTVALAFDYFARQKVDIAIVEVGMGGRLDSTNIITPELSVITNIGFDHTQFLGDTLAKIAAEKGGIIKVGVPVVVGEYHTETFPVFAQLAEKLNAPLTLARDRFDLLKSTVTDNGIRNFLVRRKENERQFHVELDLLGSYQEKNMLTVLSAMEIVCLRFSLGFSTSLDALKHTASTTGLMGRWQVLCKQPLVVADIAHNAHGLAEVVDHIKSIKFNSLHMVLGVVSDKDVHAMLSMLPHGAKFYFTQPSIPRAMSVENLYSHALSAGFDGEKHATVGNAIESAMKNAKPNDMVYIGGSAFVVADGLQYWNSNLCFQTL